MGLTDVFARNVKFKGAAVGEKHTDGGGLYLLVKQAGKYWRLDYRYLEKRKTLALGVYPAVSLAQARQRAAMAQSQLADGLDPSAAKKQEKQAKLAASRNTFGALTEDWLNQKAKKIAASTVQTARSQLENHVLPMLATRPLEGIKPPQILEVLRKIEGGGTSYTATRMRSIMAQIFRFGIQTGRTETNPAADMQGVVVAPRTTHRPALTEAREFSEFLVKLNGNNQSAKLTKLCAKLGVLTWTRPGELRMAEWVEFNLESREWKVPAARMKTGKQLQAHTVPLSVQAIEILKALSEISSHSPRLFPGNGKSPYISENTVNQAFKRMGYKDRQSHHGLRASARSLLAERGWTREALERQLDHKEADMSVAAYARSTHLPERRKFMDDWGNLVAALESGSAATVFQKIQQ